MSSHDEHRLREVLDTQARRGAPQPVGVDAVTTRARRIRRRRTTLAALSTAAVVALAVPLGMTMGGTPGSEDEPPVAGERERSGPAQVALDVDRLDAGDPPGVVRLDRSTLVTADGDEIELGNSRRQVAAFGDGYAVQGIVDDETGERVVEVVDTDGEVTWSSPTLDSFAVSTDGTLLVFADHGGRLQLLQAGETSPTPLEVQNSQPATPVAVTGSAPCGSDCSVYYAVSGPDGGVNVLSVGDGYFENAGPFQRLDAVTADGLRAGQISSEGTSSCSALLKGRRQLWRTCDHSLGDFSPDGRHLVGTDAYLDGAGRSVVALLGVADGDPVVTYEVDTRAGDVIADWAWEDDEHLLLTVHSGGSWQVVRAGLDGTAELATGPAPGEAHEPSIVLGPRH